MRRNLVGWLLLIVTMILTLIVGVFRHAHAMEFQEVKPYVFADLPQGRIYKAVHGWHLMQQHQYSITAGRGCK